MSADRWEWKIEGTKNQYGAGSAPRGFTFEGGEPGHGSRRSERFLDVLHALAHRDIDWDQLDPDEEIIVTITPRYTDDDGEDA